MPLTPGTSLGRDVALKVLPTAFTADHFTRSWEFDEGKGSGRGY